MSLNVCPQCGAEYIRGTMLCADDGSYLVAADDPSLVAPTDADAGDHGEGTGATAGSAAVEIRDGEVAYDLGDWDIESRVLLDRLLVGEGIRHVWEAATLVVGGYVGSHLRGLGPNISAEQRTDALIDQVEASTGERSFDPDREQVVYELEDWPEEKRYALAMSLADHGITSGFDEDDNLIVYEDDEAAAEPIIDQVDANFSVDASTLDGDSDGDGDDGQFDGVSVQDKLSDLFVAVDRLMHRATDREGVLGLVDAAKAIGTLRVPYGFAEKVWSDIVDRAEALRALIEDDGTDEAGDDATDADPADGDTADRDTDDGDADEELSDDERIQAAARELRETLRNYV